MCFYRNFRNLFFFFNFYKKHPWNFDRDCIHLQIALGDMDILTILILLIQDSGMFFPGIEYCV